jgi:hypothetical protein
MSNFPTLVPATVSITPGVVPTTLQVGYDGSSTTSTADTVPAGDALVMTFQGLSEAQARSVPDHQLSQQGRSFAFNSATLAASETPPGFRWTYARPVTQDDIRAVPGTEFYALSVEFVGVWIRRASTPSASVRIRLRTTGGRALPAGTPSASVNLRITTTGAGMQSGTPAQSTLLLLKTTGAGIISTPLNDPDYSSVILHLPLTSDSGFADACGRSLSVTPQGGVTIEATGGRWGNGSALFDGSTTGWLKAALDQAIGTSDYTIRFWINLISIASSNRGLFRVTYESNQNYIDPNRYWLAAGLNTSRTIVGDQHVDLYERFTTSASVAIGTWCFVQQTRQAGLVTTSISNVGQATVLYPSGSAPDVDWSDSNFAQTFFDIGIRLNTSQTVNARFSDFQVSLVARPHVVPTGPLPIF